MKTEAVRRVLDKFEAARSGVLLSAIGRTSGWRTVAGAMLFLECHINLDRSLLAEVLDVAQVREIHYVNCLFSAHNLDTSFKQRGIVTVAADKLFWPANAAMACEGAAVD